MCQQPMGMRTAKNALSNHQEHTGGEFYSRWVSSYSEVRLNCPSSDLCEDTFQKLLEWRLLSGAGGSQRGRRTWRFSHVINFTLTCYLIFTNSLQAIWVDKSKYLMLFHTSEATQGFHSSRQVGHGIYQQAGIFWSGSSGPDVAAQSI